MTTKPLDRLMFVQGGNCFFCKESLPKAEASVEHLLASSIGGANSDDNCVACCKAVNALLGSMSLKEKFQVVLNQRGKFECPNKKILPPPKAASKVPTKVFATKVAATSKANDEHLETVVANLKARGNSKPRSLKTLTSTLVSLLPKGQSKPEIEDVLQKLQASGLVTITEGKVSYAL